MPSKINTKVVAVLITAFVLWLALMRIGFLVTERQSYQAEAVQSVQQSYASAQTIVGPVLERQCTESWEAWTGDGHLKAKKLERREFTLRSVPSNLTADAQLQADARYRGLFKVNGYSARMLLDAAWEDLSALVPSKTQSNSTVTCLPANVWLSMSDVRGLRSAQWTIDGNVVNALPGTLSSGLSQGLHANVDSLGDKITDKSASLRVKATVQFVGTEALSLVPSASNTDWSLQSDWPHPSFGGRFLPVERQVGQSGFSAKWSLSSLATSASREVQRGESLCPSRPAPGNNACLDTLSVSFIDPVNPYVLSDRAIKYGMLFVVLTFAAVAMTEALSRYRARRVHPLQYAMVGLALCIFFLLLLSLSEHMSFHWAYAGAATACVLLIGFYARHMLGRARDGWLFTAGIALLYGLMYVLLSREQTALVVGSIMLFAMLALVMVMTRRVDWYALTTGMPCIHASQAPEKADAQPGAGNA